MSSATLSLSDLSGRILLSVEEVAALLGIKRTAAYEAARRGQLPAKRLGRRVVIPVPAFLEWLGLVGGVHASDPQSRLDRDGKAS